MFKAVRIRLRRPPLGWGWPALFAALGATAALASPGDLDFTFSNDGKVTTAFPGATAQGRSIAVQADGKILLGGSSISGGNPDFALARYLADGSPDTSFDGDGRVTTPIGSGTDRGYSVAVQPDGKILLAGSSSNDFALARYNTDGTLDTSFSGDGKLTTNINGTDEAYAVAVQPDGKILMSGYCQGLIGVARYQSDGTPDTSFSGDGVLTTAFGSDAQGLSLAVQADGKILVGGRGFSGVSYDFVLARYNADGTLDPSFSADGKVTTDIAGGFDVGSSLALQADGRIVQGGTSDIGNGYNFAVVRYEADGTLDSGFSGDGKVTTNLGGVSAEAYSVALQSNGKILLAGWSYPGTNDDFALVRYQADGALDTSFSGDGKLTTDFSNSYEVALSVAVQPDGRILLGGTSGNNFAIARYEGDISDTTPPTLTNLGVATSGASNGLPYMRIQAADAGSGVLKVQLTANSSNCHLEYPLGTRVAPQGTPRPHTLILPSSAGSLIVYVVKDTNATAHVEVRAWDAADNTTLLDPVVANLEIKKGRRLARTFSRIPAAEHYITLQNGSPGLTQATLWVNGHVVSRGPLTDGQVVTLDVASAMRAGKHHTVRIAASGPPGASAVLVIGDSPQVVGGSAAGLTASRWNLEF